MVAWPLVDRDIADGEALIKQLDRDRFSVSGAFWHYRPEAERWTLVIVSPVVAAEGPLEAYRRLIRSLRRVRSTRARPFALDSSRVQVMKEEDELPSLLRHAVVTGHDVTGIRVPSGTIKGRFVEEAYIYRLEQPIAA
jgi:hypothetical protein